MSQSTPFSIWISCLLSCTPPFHSFTDLLPQHFQHRFYISCLATFHFFTLSLVFVIKGKRIGSGFRLMGIYEEEKYLENQEQNQKALKTFTACLWSCLVSILGGLILGWWEYEYHHTNSQQWMVPFGLILFVTPAIVWFAVFVSEICNSTDDNHLIKTGQPVSDADEIYLKEVAV